MNRWTDDTPQVPSEENEAQPMDEQFLRRSKFALRFSRYLLLMALAIVLIGLVIANRDNINMDNFRRLMAKIDLGISDGSSRTGESIEFDYDEDGKIAPFKDGLVYLTPSKLTIMDNRGTRFFSVNTGFTAPEVLTTDRFVVTYDRGGNRILVTNSFAVVFEKTTDHPILSVSMNKKGYLAVITQSDRYKNTLLVFDHNFEEVFTWNSTDRYLLSAEISPDNQSVALSCYNTSGETAQAELVCVRTDQEEIYWSVPLEEGLPLKIAYKSAGDLAVLQANSLSFYNAKGEKKNTFTPENAFIQQFDLSQERYSVLAVSDSRRGACTLCIVDNNGKQTQAVKLTECIDYMSVCDGQIALLGEQKTYVCSADSSKILYEKENAGSVKRVCLSGKNNLFDIYASKAVYTDIQ